MLSANATLETDTPVLLSERERGRRILYVVGQLRAGGLERQLYFLLQAMDRTRLQPEVVAWNFRKGDLYAPKLQALGVKVHAFDQARSGADKTRALRRLVLQRRPEVVHSYSFYTNFAAWAATLGTSSIPIGAVQSDFVKDKEWAGPWLGRLSARYPQGQICNSFNAAANVRDSRGPFAPSRPFVVRNGVDLQMFTYRCEPPPGPASIIAVGSLLPVKRWDRLVRAAATLKQRGLAFRLTIVGDGPLRESLEALARELGVADRVSLGGHSNDVAGLLDQSSFLVHTSATEGCPNVVMEAMACGRAVIATSVGDVGALVEDGRTGFVVPVNEDAALADRMAILIGSREMAARMGAAAAARARAEFGVDRLVTETLAVYRSLGWPGA